MSLVEVVTKLTDPAVYKKARLPQVYNQAKTALAECEKMDECKQWADKSEALRSYARQTNDTTLETMCKRIKLRAMRRLGELLEDVERSKGGGAYQKRNLTRDGPVPSKTRKQTAEDAGVSERQRKQALRIAQMPDFEEQVESDDPPSLTEFERQSRAAYERDLRDPLREEKSRAFSFRFEIEEAEECIKKALLNLKFAKEYSNELEEIKRKITSLQSMLDQIEEALK